MLPLAPVRTVAPVATPITLDDAKQHLKILDDTEDRYIQDLIEAVTAYVDGYTGVLGRALITQTWRQDFWGFCGSWQDNCCSGTWPLRLAVGPVQSISSITYYDALNAQQTLSASVYSLYADALGGYLALVQGQTWPAVYERSDAVRITYVAGFGSAPSSVPANIRHLIKLLLSHWFENREAVAFGNFAPQEVSMQAQALLRSARRVGF